MGRPDDDWTEQTRIQTTGSVRRIPTAHAIVRGAAKPVVPLRVMRQAPTLVTIRARERTVMWPVFLCGFVAGIFGGLALMKSPAAKKPAVQHVVQEANAIVRAAVR